MPHIPSQHHQNRFVSDALSGIKDSILSGTEGIFRRRSVRTIEPKQHLWPNSTTTKTSHINEVNTKSDLPCTENQPTAILDTKSQLSPGKQQKAELEKKAFEAAAQKKLSQQELASGHLKTVILRVLENYFRADTIDGNARTGDGRVSVDPSAAFRTMNIQDLQQHNSYIQEIEAVLIRIIEKKNKGGSQEEHKFSKEEHKQLRKMGQLTKEEHEQLLEIEQRWNAFQPTVIIPTRQRFNQELQFCRVKDVMDDDMKYRALLELIDKECKGAMDVLLASVNSELSKEDGTDYSDEDLQEQIQPELRNSLVDFLAEHIVPHGLFLHRLRQLFPLRESGEFKMINNRKRAVSQLTGMTSATIFGLIEHKQNLSKK